ncbi:uncharacterized protein TNIN_144171 [Trichonephila inaurata madagascariensis]|uniref:Uncharacterized protein n=1 Tax=Trichonephila inaurata madagascariensis TaxID=2747483 RepID=A0A8X6X356_9ARAC|nr:uncharacterized protein TNIN_144171 [Trichonephila inaurata madagascariensis]
MFIDLYTISDVNEAFDRKRLRNFDASNLPPCKSELLQQFLRANYTCTIWNNAHLKSPATYQPENNGWASKMINTILNGLKGINYQVMSVIHLKLNQVCN